MCYDGRSYLIKLFNLKGSHNEYMLLPHKDLLSLPSYVYLRRLKRQRNVLNSTCAGLGCNGVQGVTTITHTSICSLTLPSLPEVLQSEMYINLTKLCLVVFTLYFKVQDCETESTYPNLSQSKIKLSFVQLGIKSSCITE